VVVGTYRAILVITISTRLRAYVGDSFISFSELRSRSNVSVSSGVVKEIGYAECDALVASAVTPFTFDFSGTADGSAFQQTTTGSPMATVNSLEFIT
jgi:hypothetical protein